MLLTDNKTLPNDLFTPALSAFSDLAVFFCLSPQLAEYFGNFPHFLNSFESHL